MLARNASPHPPVDLRSSHPLTYNGLLIPMQCPHCLCHFHDAWSVTSPLAEDADGLWWGVAYTTCHACRKVVLKVGKAQATRNQLNAIYFVSMQQPMTLAQSFQLVHPRGSSRQPVPTAVPAEFSADYSEACLVLPDSEKASAALSRRCLQYLLREKAGFKKRDLADQIQEALDSKTLPSHLADDLDAIRVIGNFSAHPNKSTSTGEIVDVEPHEAEWSLNVLEGLFDFYFVQPERAKARRAAINEKLKSAGKPPMKQP